MTSKPPAPNPNQGRLFIGAMFGLVLLGGVASFFISVKKAPVKAPYEDGIIYITPIPRVSPPPPVKPEPPPSGSPAPINLRISARHSS